jgi:hypothetical protein
MAKLGRGPFHPGQRKMIRKKIDKGKVSAMEIKNS